MFESFLSPRPIWPFADSPKSMAYIDEDRVCEIDVGRPLFLYADQENFICMMVSSAIPGLSADGRRFFFRMKVVRDHVLLALAWIDRLSQELSSFFLRDISPRDIARAMRVETFLPPSWVSLVGIEEDLDEYGLRDRAEDEAGNSFSRIEGWMVADAYVTPSAASLEAMESREVYDDPSWLENALGDMLRVSRDETQCRWVSLDPLLEEVPEASIEALVHQDVVELCGRPPEWIRGRLDLFREQLLQGCKDVFVHYGQATRSGVFVR